MSRSRVRKQCTGPGKDAVVQPHLRSSKELCTRCHHRWPCPSAVAGEDLPATVGCTDVDDLLLYDVHRHVPWVALGLVVDTGKRRRAGGRLRILWSLSSRGHVFVPQLTADLERYGEPPCDGETRQVLGWLEDSDGTVWGTRRSVAEQCGAALGWPASRVERCLLWAEADGLLHGPDST